MKILFVWPCNTGSNWVPLGISILSALAKKAGHEVDLFDTSFYKIVQKGFAYNTEERVKHGEYIETDFNKTMNYQNKTFEEIISEFEHKINSFRPDIIAMSLMTQFFGLGRDLLSSLQGEASKIPVVVGGPHAHVAADEILGHDCFDIVCIYEGEGPFIKLLECFQKNSDYKKIPGLWIKTADGIIKNQYCSLRNLDENPCSDLELFEERYFYQPYLSDVYRIISYEMQRGCPYKCTYCINEFLQQRTKGKGKYTRRRSQKNVIADLKLFKGKYRPEIIRFLDETFLLLKEEELKEFAEVYKREIALPFFITTRPESITPQKSRILSDMGCTAVSIGIEHGSPAIREQVLGRKMSNESIVNAFKNLRNVCIRSSAYNLIGVPYESRDTILETIKLNREADPDSTISFILLPFRRTAISNLSKELGFLPEDFNDETYFHDASDSVLRLPDISKEELNALKRVFTPYVYLPKVVYPLVKRAEINDDIGNVILSELIGITSHIQEQRESTKVQSSVLQANRKKLKK